MKTAPEITAADIPWEKPPADVNLSTAEAAIDRIAAAGLADDDAIIEQVKAHLLPVLRRLDPVARDAAIVYAAERLPGITAEGLHASLREHAEILASLEAEVDELRGDAKPPEEAILGEMIRQNVRREALRRINAEERGGSMPTELLTLKERLAQPRPAKVQWTIPKWQTARSRAVLAAQRKAGKTIVVGNLCRSLVDGDDFLGVATMTPIAGTVAILDFEMAEAQLLVWLDEQGIRNTEKVLLVSMRGQASAFDLLDAGVRSAWAALLAEHGVRYLIIDCLRPVLDALGLDENHEAGRFLVALDALLAEAQIPDCLVVHHMGHAGERSRGDSRLRDWPDVEWRLVRQGDDDTAPRFLTAFGRDVEQPETQLMFDPTTRRLTAIGGTRREAQSDADLDVLLAGLKDAPEPLSGRAVETLFDRVLPRARVRAALRRATQGGRVVTTPGAHGAVLHSVPTSSAPVRRSAPPVRRRSANVCASAPIGRGADAHTGEDCSKIEGGALDEVVEL
jgi:hypothetical protein